MNFYATDDIGPPGADGQIVARPHGTRVVLAGLRVYWITYWIKNKTQLDRRYARRIFVCSQGRRMEELETPGTFPATIWKPQVHVLARNACSCRVIQSMLIRFGSPASYFV